MINFLPELYEDEILYSVIARYKRMCGMLSKRALMKDLFGDRAITKSIFFPMDLKSLVNNLPFTSKITTDEIIMNHTMHPFYTAFLSNDKANFIATEMAESHGIAIENYLGIGGSKTKIGHYLMYCPICFQEDLESLGESYWRRSHQVVGALYCGKHEVLLRNSTVANTGDLLDYTCADESVCTTDTQVDSFRREIKKLNLEYIRNAGYIMTGNYQRKDFAFIVNAYIDLLRNRKLTSINGHIYAKEVQNQFFIYYPTEYLELMQSSVNINQGKNWLSMFVRNDNVNKSPLRHLLFIQYLGIDIVEFFKIKNTVGKVKENKNDIPKFDKKDRRKKWLQIIEENKGLNRTELRKIGKGLQKWVIKYDRDWYDMVTPKATDTKHRTVYIDWKTRDMECLGLAKIAVREILDSPEKPIKITIASITRRVGERVWFRKSKKLIKTRKFMKSVTENAVQFRTRKIKWAIKELYKNNDYITPTKVGLYAGLGGVENVKSIIEKELESYDKKEWINIVTYSNKSRNVDLIDWDKRDKECFRKVKIAYESIINQKGKPVRISNASILRVADIKRGLFNSRKMSRTNEYLKKINEDIEKFRLRKIKWAIEEMKEKKVMITPHKVQIYAGFGGGSKEVRDLILKILKKT